MSARLYIKQVQDQITELLRAWPELVEDDVLRADMIEGETTAHEFLSRVVRKIGYTKSVAAGLVEYIGELQARKERLERREHSLRSLLFKVLNSADLRRAELPEATLSIRNGTPRVVITNESELPADFFRIKREPDKSRIKAALVANQNVPGACLSNAEATLSILVK